MERSETGITKTGLQPAFSLLYPIPKERNRKILRFFREQSESFQKVALSNDISRNGRNLPIIKDMPFLRACDPQRATHLSILRILTFLSNIVYSSRP